MPLSYLNNTFLASSDFHSHGSFPNCHIFYLFLTFIFIYTLYINIHLCIINIWIIICLNQDPSKVHTLWLVHRSLHLLIYSFLCLLFFFLVIFCLKKLGHLFSRISAVWILLTALRWCSLCDCLFPVFLINW